VRATLDRTPPVVGSIWRERNGFYRLRTAEVVDVDCSFVYVLTKTNSQGMPVVRTRANGEPWKPSRVSLRLWHGSWEPT
jgi:hypothetical protein